jgi:AraC-like DNA-binding protein
MPVEQHLILQVKEVPPSAEWQPHSQGWLCLRLAAGQGYWLQGKVPARPLAEGDVLLVANRARGAVRASQLNPVILHYFIVEPRQLTGLLTVSEGNFLGTARKSPAHQVLAFAATTVIGEKFARQVADPAAGQLAGRCACLQLWAEAMAGLMSAGLAVSEDKLRGRFRRLVGQIPETELAGNTLAELSARLHCSERHFSRLFREEFGVSLRARQMELRLQRARHLLASSNAKIIHVALDSGYRHLGLFNILFKRRFGMTPSQWRRQNLPKQPVVGLRRGLPKLVPRLAARP